MEELGSKPTDRPPDSRGYGGELEQDAPFFDPCLRDFNNVGDRVKESGGDKVE